MSMVRTHGFHALLLLAACTPRAPESPQAPAAPPPNDTHQPAAASTNPPPAAPAPPSSLLPEQERWLDENCFGGAPKKTRQFGSTHVVAREAFALEHSDDLKIPLWVCEHVTRAEIATKRAKRSIEVTIDGKSKSVNLIPFMPDPKLPPGVRAELRDYQGSGYDRGHMAPAADFSASWCAMESSFYLSNMAPQIGNGFNRGVWARLEGAVRGYVERFGEAWVVTGGFFRGNDAARTIGPNQVAVPTHFFKLVVVPAETDAERPRAAAFVLANEAQPNLDDLQPFVTAIDDVEAWTGLDLMPELASAIAAPLERATADLASW